MFVLVIKVGIFIMFIILIQYLIIFLLFRLPISCFASIHLIYDLVLTTCIGIFHAYYEVLKYTFQFR